jgi:hypothetical protein
MKTNSLTDTKNIYVTNQELKSTDVEIGNVDLILSYMRKESYKHHLRTAIQEYLSNALDAHREAGQKNKKVIVKAPTHQDPTLSIKDFGVGMSPERIEKIWSKVGNSSKRDNNKSKGGFGAGSKTLWAYTDVFLINTIVDGLKYEYEATVARKIGGEIILKKQPTPTKEPNGTEIKTQIHPNDVFKAQEAIKRFCFFCEESEMPTVSGIDDVPTVHQLQKMTIGVPNDEMQSAYFLKIDDVPHSMLGTNSHDKIMFVLDGIPYVVEKEYINTFNRVLSKIKGQLIVKFKTGIIKPQLSREAIMVCEENTKAVQSVCQLVEKKLTQEIDFMLKDSTNIKDFMNNFFKVQEKYTLPFAKFKDYTFNNNHMVTSDVFQQFVFDYRTKRYSGSVKKEENYFKINLNPTHVNNNYWGDLSIESESKMGRRINEVMINNQNILVIKKPENVKESVFKELIELFQLKSIHEVEPKEIERKEKEKKIKAAESYNLHLISTHYYGVNKRVENYKEEHLNGKTIVYLPLEDYSKSRNNDELKNTFNFFKGRAIFCFIGKEELKRIEQLKKVKVLSLKEFSSSLEQNPKDLLLVIKAKALNTSICHTLLNKFKLEPSAFKNKTMSKILALYKENDNFLASSDFKIPSFVTKLYQKDKELENFLTMDEEFSNLFKEKLPLITSSRDWESLKLNEEAKTDLVNYINLKTK